MEITVEISYYPLMEDFKKPVEEFLDELNKIQNITLEPGTMSSILSGSFDDVMKVLSQKLKPFLKKYPSVFSLKISNSCPACLTEQKE